jgi:hypothetical protein
MSGATLSSYLESARATYSELGRAIDFVLPHVYLHEGERELALASFDENIRQYPSSELERDGLYGKFLNVLYVEGDASGAEALLASLSLLYPGSEEELVAREQLRVYELNLGGIEEGRDSVELVKDYGESLPRKFPLDQNYPNPFNPTTTIKYELPEDSHVSLKIYDVLGREVLSLVDRVETAGQHQVVLNASNLSSGVYFYRLKAGDFTDTKRLLLLR